jgi:hypothetical protein
MMRELFRALGTLSSFKDKLKSIVTAGAILYTVYLSILAEMSSGPFDFVVSRDARSVTSSWSHSNSSGKSFGCEAVWNSVKWTGACDLLKQDAKECKTLAFFYSCEQWNHLELV